MEGNHLYTLVQHGLGKYYYLMHYMLHLQFPVNSSSLQLGSFKYASNIFLHCWGNKPLHLGNH